LLQIPNLRFLSAFMPKAISADLFSGISFVWNFKKIHQTLLADFYFILFYFKKKKPMILTHQFRR